MGKSIETESRLVGVRGWGKEGIGEWVLVGTRVLLGWWKSFETRERWWLHSIVNTLDTSELYIFKKLIGTSLVAQWLRVHLPMQGTRVRALVWVDPTCHGATKPVSHNYWACALEPMSHNYWAHKPQLLKPACLEPMLRNKRSHCNEKPAHLDEE